VSVVNFVPCFAWLGFLRSSCTISGTSFASHLLDQGVKITDVAKLLGHAKPTTTLAFYAHPLHADDVSHIDRLMAARQAVHQANDHLNDQIVRTTQTRKPENVGKKW
jgi:integrase